MGGISLTHILLILLIVLIFFGPSRLPALGQSLGKAIRGFKQGLSEIDVDAKDVSQQPPTNQASQNVLQNDLHQQTQAEKELQKQTSDIKKS